MDVKFWGPSGWELFHVISLRNDQEVKELFSVFQDVLPCKYCRQSTRQFVREEPPQGNLAVWLYNLHNKVNKKLYDQHLKDPSVPLPKPSPTFENAIKYYKTKINNPRLGYDFLYSVALNYQSKIHKSSSHEKFWKLLSVLYPRPLRIPRLTHYFTDVHSILEDPEDLQVVYNRIKKFKSKCVKKTCRKTRRKK
jgi:hypothetical protein